MNIFTSKPIEEKSKTDFKNIRHGKSVAVSPHAYDHLSIAQRKIFKDVIDMPEIPKYKIENE